MGDRLLLVFAGVIVFAATNSLTDSLPAINTFDVAVLRGYLTADR